MIFKPDLTWCGKSAAGDGGGNVLDDQLFECSKRLGATVRFSSQGLAKKHLHAIMLQGAKQGWSETLPGRQNTIGSIPNWAATAVCSIVAT